MTGNGFIKLHRKIMNWTWWKDRNAFRLFVTFLLCANHAPCVWRGLQLEAGQFGTNLTELQGFTGLSRQELRTAMSKLKSTQEATYISTRKYVVVTIENWASYQTVDKSSTQSSTSNQLENNTPIRRRSKEDKKETSAKKEYGYLGNVLLTEEQYAELVGKYGRQTVDKKIERMNKYQYDNNDYYSDHNRTLRNWLKNCKPLSEQSDDGVLDLYEEKMNAAD